ncbi:polyphosphate polymerase domain-containing protein [Dactylosporangium sp. AC04546]|uniref:polyphosphate polymerase domain-containing protein n=1 Tax=Dactylosporangium sp. AC04546 TaxID=2862460 RepID=UPI001EDF79D1|nr:polyphosphate polymerase domain-containing protein [Dactylosporangium sp. AC04546]WVK88528.1 polyphosphate polymerase domain-containing protein [Dactylosporangium sp. AC04546]
MRWPFRRRTVPPDRSPGTVPAPPGAARSDDHGGHALRAPSKLHAFNRYEIKYLMPGTAIPALRAELDRRLDRDSHGADGGYGVWSVYYDTRDLRFYWEKIEGLRFRRKLRVRHYGDRFTVDDDTNVFVEIKQRVNRVTQKRRVALPYRLARELCDGRAMVEHEPAQRAFLEEVLELVSRLDLRPVAMTGYQREAFVGRGAESGLRVTVDQRLRGRDRDFHLGADAENRLIVPARLAVVEFKANERVPYWLTDLAAELNLSVVRISKYCQSVEAFGRAPRSIFHVPDTDPAAAPAATRNEA